MSQVAQQDHLYIEVADLSDVTEAEKAQLLSAWKRNVLDDVVFVSAGLHTAVIGWVLDDPDTPTSLLVNFVYDGGVSEINITL